MSDNWFYTHAGAYHGPISTEHLLSLVGTGGLVPDDMIWPESVAPTAAIRAEAALTFPSSAPAVPMGFPVQPSPLPEWVRALTNAGVDVPTLESLANPPARAWLDDVRRLEQAPRRPPNPAAAEAAPPPPWPVSQDYNEAVQSPATNFADADLRSGHAVTSALGIPQPCSGNFADVYQVGRPDGLRWAVKCFTRQATGLRERYQEISRHLRRARLRFMVDFTYLEQGIRVVGQMAARPQDGMGAGPHAPPVRRRARRRPGPAGGAVPGLEASVAGSAGREGGPRRLAARQHTAGDRGPTPTRFG